MERFFNTAGPIKTDLHYYVNPLQRIDVDEDVRDYRIVLSNQDIITGGCAFNIKAESLHLGNFSKEEIHELYMQHTTSTEQEFDEGCFPLIWEATEGQPWLVNALGNEVTMQMRENRDRSIRIIPEMV